MWQRCCKPIGAFQAGQKSANFEDGYTGCIQHPVILYSFSSGRKRGGIALGYPVCGLSEALWNNSGGRGLFLPLLLFGEAFCALTQTEFVGVEGAPEKLF